MKEAAFGSRGLIARLAARDEMMFSVEEADDVPLYLRRKSEQGKGRRDH